MLSAFFIWAGSLISKTAVSKTAEQGAIPCRSAKRKVGVTVAQRFAKPSTGFTGLQVRFLYLPPHFGVAKR